VQCASYVFILDKLMDGSAKRRLQVHLQVTSIDAVVLA